MSKLINTQLTTNFNLIEFACKDGTPVPEEYYDNVAELAKQLQVLRDHLGEPVHISSAYRTPAHNKKVGGKSKSMHLVAKAADITIKSKTPKQLAAIVEMLIFKMQLNIGGLGIYPGFVHIDTRRKRARW